MAPRKLPPRELVCQLLHYDPDTGDFIWLPRPREMFPTDHHWRMWNTQNAGQAAGSLGSHLYYRISINDTGFATHRLAWLIVHGEPVPPQIDHIDRDRLNNRIANLRAATGVQNRGNTLRPKDNTSGVKGVGIEKGRFRARIMTNGRRLHLGSFNTAEEAANAYRDAAIRLLGEFAPPLD
jgi:hypothetical protein